MGSEMQNGADGPRHGNQRNTSTSFFVPLGNLFAYESLRVSLGAYVVMNIQDALIGVFGKDAGLAIGATFFGALAAFICFRLGRGTAE